MSEKNTKKTGLVLSCWIVAALILLIVFFVKSNDIVKNLRETNFFERVFGTTPEFAKKPEKESPADGAEKKPSEPLQIETAPVPETAMPVEPVPARQPPEKKPVPDRVEPVPAVAGKTDAAGTAGTGKNVQAPQAPVKAVPPAPAVTDVKLCFVQIDADGNVNRKQIVRSLPRTDVPLTASIQALLDGPQLADRKSGCMSLIPKGTKLLGVTVKDGVALLNFSEDFEYNTYGVEGYLGQLMQIVYTATSFSTVSSVQFLLEGQKKEYLGSEGVWIGSPLARSTFR